MVLIWKNVTQSNKYLIIDLDTMEILGTASTEDEGAAQVMKLGFGEKRNVELYEATGFSNWKESLRTSTEKMKKHAKGEG